MTLFRRDLNDMQSVPAMFNGRCTGLSLSYPDWAII